MNAPRPAIRLRGVGHRYRRTIALDTIDLEVAPGSLTGIIGPDGVGKSTLLGLTAGVRRLQAGTVEVLGENMAEARARRRVCTRVAYMPQGLGHNLYPDLSVAENISYFGRLFGLDRPVLEDRLAALVEATGLAPFAGRRARQLSGGMQQKLGLCCALIHQPDLLILDEPTTGVDPLSRRQLWQLIEAIRAGAPEMTVLVATSYMEEAEAFDHLVMMNAGRVLAQGRPSALKARTRSRTLDRAYAALLPAEMRHGHRAFKLARRNPQPGGPAVEARGLTRRFDGFTAVDAIDFHIERGEIFGFVGPNGCGKTTTMKMVTGLLRSSEGEADMLGRPVEAGDRGMRRQLGYMSQSFSLYGELTVEQNLRLHARLFGVPEAEIARRSERMADRFGLGAVYDQRAEALPLGMRQRLSLAVAAIHKPKILVLDEPTSGVDPLARDQFWHLIGELSRKDGVTAFVSTHYLNEAMRCDRVALMNAGRILACAEPSALVEAKRAKTLSDAFVAFILDDQQRTGEVAPSPAQLARRGREAETPGAPAPRRYLDPRRLAALVKREATELARDRFRLFSAFLVPVILTLVFGFGLSLDIERLPFAVLDQDRTPESRGYIEQFAASRFFDTRAPARDPAGLERRLRGGEIRLGIEIPSGFGRRLRSGRRPEVGMWIEGTMPFRAETTLGYARQMHIAYLVDIQQREALALLAARPMRVETRYWYNQALKSRIAFVPGLIATVLMLVSAMITAAAVVREKELGTITNFHATPLTRLEFLLGKQIPFAAISLVNCVVLSVLAVVVFGIEFGGSALALAIGSVLFVLAATAVGLLVSAFTRTQVAAVLATLVLTMGPAFQYSGLISPVSSLTGGGYLFGVLFPTSYFLNVTVGTFTKDLGVADLAGDYAALGLAAVILGAVTLILLRKQTR